MLSVIKEKYIYIYILYSVWLNCTEKLSAVIFYHQSHWVLHYIHDDVIKWKYFSRYWPFVRGIHRSPVNSPHKGQWREPLMLSLICAWINNWVNNREAGDLRHYRAHYDVTVMIVHQFALPCSTPGGEQDEALIGNWRIIRLSQCLLSNFE